VSRVAYSDADKAARAVVMDWMRAAQLTPTIDYAGSIIARRPGSNASLKLLLFGSHVDSVPEGGNYDGNLGSLAAIKVAQTLAEQHIVTKLDQAKRKKGDIAGYFELHIEQRGTLEASKINVGVVEGIVGIEQWEVTVTGVQNHAGTTAMDQRHDARLSAANVVEMVNTVVRRIPGRQVGTVGKMQAFPGAPNVIPGKVVCTLELRDLDDVKVDKMYAQISARAKAIGDQNATQFAYAELHVNSAAPSDPRMRQFVSAAATSLSLTSRVMPSGAGHDAQAMAQLGPMGMIFIPSIGGISHSPNEFSTPRDCTSGANVLLRAVLAADHALP
jgi:N-carbamoyl-L-amino-acid hydrolase